MIYNFDGKTASEAWGKAARAFLTDGIGADQSGRGGDTMEILHAVFSLSEPTQRWVINRVPAMNPAFAIVETIWILSGRNDAGFLNYWNRKLPSYAGNNPTYHGAYGHRLRHQSGIDQLERAYLALKNKPESRRVALGIWDPILDLPDVDGEPVSSDIPCNVVSLLKVRNEKLEWTQVVRSNDLFLGLPYNIVQFTTLQEVMAGWLGLDVGNYVQYSDSLHVYTRDAEVMGVDECIDGSMRNTDHLALPKDKSQVVLTRMIQAIDCLTEASLCKQRLISIISDVDLPLGYRNLLLVTAAETARRRKWDDLSCDLINGCTNPLLRAMWVKWAKRYSSNFVST